MKILIIHSYFHPLFDNKVEGGIETHTANLYDCLTKAGHSVTVACTKDSETTRNHILIDNISKDRSTGKRYSHLQGYDSLLKSIRDSDWELIINNNPSATVLSAVSEAAAIANKKVTHFLHGVPGGPGTPNFIAAINKENVIPVAVSEYIKRVFTNLGVKRNIEVLKSTFHEPTVDFIPVPVKNQLVFFGRLVSVRNLMDVVNLVVNHLPDHTLKIIGSGVNHPVEIEYLNKVKELAGDNSRIEWLGRLSQHEAHSIIAESEAMFNMCPVEAFGLAAFEAQTLGVPVIYEKKGDHQLPGPSEFVIDGVTGVAVDTYRADLNTRMKKMAEAVKAASTLDRKSIYDHFKNKYGINKYVLDLDRLVSKSVEATF